MGSLARVIIGLRSKKAKGSDHESDEHDDMMSDDEGGGSDMGPEVIADDILQAINDKDSTALTEALRSFVDYCKD